MFMLLCQFLLLALSKHFLYGHEKYFMLSLLNMHVYLALLNFFALI